MRHLLLLPVLLAPLASQSAGLPSLPFAFVENKGQWQGEFTHRASLGAVTASLWLNGWTLETGTGAADSKLTSIRFRFEGSHTRENQGLHPQAGKHNWCLGSDASQWVWGARGFGQVALRSVYPGIDVLMRPSTGVFEYDLLLSPGADLDQVRMHCDGTDSLAIAANGDLVIQTARGPLTQARPRTWSTLASGERKMVDCDFVVLGKNTYGFRTKTHSASLPLVVDPGLVWASYAGGSSDDVIEGIALAPNGELLLVGTTKSTDLATTAGAAMPIHGGGREDMFVARLTADGKQFVYVTYLGGNGNDLGRSVAVDATGTHICGSTRSTDMPTTADALMPTNRGRTDAYVASLDATGQITYGTYLGTTAFDYAHTITVSAGLLNISGTTNPSFPTSVITYQDKSQIKTFIPGFFITLDRYATPGQTNIVYSTLIGGNVAGFYMDQVHHSVNGGIVTLACEHEITGLPTSPGAFQTSRSGGRGGYVLQLDPTKIGPLAMVYATYCDSPSSDRGFFADVDNQGMITFAMSTSSGAMPTTASAFQSAPISGTDIYVGHLDPSKSGAAQLLYGSYIGGTLGSANESLYSLEVMDNGLAWIGGSSNSRNFPTTKGAWRRNFEKSGGVMYGTLIQFDFNKTGAQSLAYSTAIEGIHTYGRNRIHDILIDSATNTLVIAGECSQLMPIFAGAAQATYGGGNSDGYIMRLDPTPVPSSSSVFGNSCQGTVGMPSLVPVEEAQPRLMFSIEAQNLPASTPAVFYTGVSKTIWNGQALPLDLSFLGMTGCKIFVSGDVFVSKVSTASGTTNLRFRMPADWSLVGATIYNQAIFLDPGANTLGVVVTNAVASTVRL